jgi:hypothetical protein
MLTLIFVFKVFRNNYIKTVNQNILCEGFVKYVYQFISASFGNMLLIGVIERRSIIYYPIKTH